MTSPSAGAAAVTVTLQLPRSERNMRPASNSATQSGMQTLVPTAFGMYRFQPSVVDVVPALTPDLASVRPLGPAARHQLGPDGDAVDVGADEVARVRGV